MEILTNYLQDVGICEIGTIIFIVPMYVYKFLHLIR